MKFKNQVKDQANSKILTSPNVKIQRGGGAAHLLHSCIVFMTVNPHLYYTPGRYCCISRLGGQ